MQSLTTEINRDGRRILLPLLGASALVLLIACGNAAALLLVRGLQRQQEYAVRSALGVGRVELFRQVSTESLLLALLGGTFGVGLAIGIVKLLKLIGGHAIPRLDAVTTGWPELCLSSPANWPLIFRVDCFACAAGQRFPRAVDRRDRSVPQFSGGNG